MKELVQPMEELTTWTGSEDVRSAATATAIAAPQDPVSWRPAWRVGGRCNDFGLDWPLHHRFGRLDGLDDPLGCIGRPAWRGRVHLLALCVAVPAMTRLIAAAKGTPATVAAAVYGVALCSMLAASTTYHRWVHQLRFRAAWRRADHALIFVAIAGTATPVVVTLMPSAGGVGFLALVWATACSGAALKVGRWRHGNVVGNAMYAVTSAVAACSLPALWAHEGVAAAGVYVGSGLLYILGAQWFARTWPRLNSAVFSYHEVWHLFTVVAAAGHFVVVWWTVT